MVAAAASAPARAPVAIRRGAAADARALHSIIHAAYRTDASWTTEEHLVRGERVSLDQLTAQLAEGAPDPIFVAHAADGGPPLGCICAEWARHHPDTDLSEECAMFGLFAVAPDAQSRGVGSALLDHALQHARDAWACTRAVLWVIKQREDILEWYARLGFEWRGEVRPFVLPELQLRDDVEFRVLHKDL